MTSPDTLRLIDGGASAPTASAMVAAPRPLPQVMRRPGEHRELHSFPNCAPLAAIRTAARRRGIETENAVTVTIERLHIARELRDAGAADLVNLLDQRSLETRTQGELWSAHGSYLQHLLGLRPCASSGHPLDSPRVSLPVRLIDRLSGLDIELLDEPDVELASAIAWEVAALVAGRTMTEWSFRTLALEGIVRG
jgi:hypothetical protein